MARVSRIMLTDVPTLKKEAKVEEAARLLNGSKSGCVVIVENNLPIGIVTELDFVRNIALKGKNLRQPVSSIMSSPVLTMSPGMKLDEALKIIDTKRFRKYPVVENGRLVGLITKKDVVNSISDNVKFHRNIQNGVLILFVVFEIFIFVFSSYLYKYFSMGA